jgi:hypothetical protein
LVVAAVRKKKNKREAGWSWRLAGIALCAFFALGMVTGLSRAGRVFAVRLASLLNFLPHRAHSALLPAEYLRRWLPPAVAPSAAGTAVALVERADGFHTVDNQGVLRGPILPAWQGDLPVLSGAGVANAPAARLLECAGVLIRAEAELAEIISEMQVGTDGQVTLFLDQPGIEINLDLDNSMIEITRAARVLALWRQHRHLITAIDMTTPGQAVVRFRRVTLQTARRGAGGGNTRAAASVMAARSTSPPEITASR